jgi:hypothetical protein
VVLLALSGGCGDKGGSNQGGSDSGTNDVGSSGQDTGTKDTGTKDTTGGTTELEWQFARAGGPMTMNSDGRAVFANLLLDGETLIATYQTAPPDTLNTAKHLYYRKYDRALGDIAAPTTAINVHEPVLINGIEVLDFDGDLGDHKLVLMGDYIYFVSILKGRNQAAVMKYDKDFSPVAGPLMFGKEDPKIEAHLDMGFCGDDHHLYAQFYYQNGSGNPNEWGASIYQINTALEEKNHAIVYPDQGSFVTGTACVFLAAGEMGVSEDRL